MDEFTNLEIIKLIDEGKLKKSINRCQDCHKIKDDVTVTFDPYAVRTSGEEVVVVLCDDCYYERCHEI
jgi:hypothetical protein